MSESNVVVVKVGKIEKHTNADSLGVTKIFDYPVIVRLGEFVEGDKAVYGPVDSVVPVTDPRWAFLSGHARIKAKRLRGIFSMGLLTAADPAWEAGQDVHEQLNIVKYEPPEPFQMGGDNEKDPGFLPVYTDVEGLRRFPDVLRPGEDVCVTEKIHGANGRAVWHEDRLWVGSHTGIKREDSTNLWWKAAGKYNLAAALQACPGVAIYFEVYGQVQDLKYGVNQSEVCRIALFDALRIVDRTYLSVDAFQALACSLGLPLVPLLYRGPWDADQCAVLAEGKSLVSGSDNVREGFVVRPAIERFDERCGRVLLKRHGEGYLTRKEKP